MQRSGWPGSVRLIRSVSVTIPMIVCRISSSGAKIWIVFPTDFDIFFTPSVPRTTGASV